MGFKTYRDRLALIFGGAFLGMWGMVFLMWWSGKLLPEMPTAIALVLGASISEFARILTFYFRKAGNGVPPPSP